MNPVRTAAAVPSIAGFTNDLLAHMEPGGIVLSGPSFFLMARPCPVDAAIEDVLNPWWRWPDEECDCWFIWLAAGDVLAAAEMLVREFGMKKWVAFQREGPPRFWRLKSALAWVKAREAVPTTKPSLSSGRA